MLKSKKGITLVALVITVIVLLILAGVTLNIVLNGGIINKSENAVAKYQDTSGNETDQINYLDAIFGNFLANVTGVSTSGGGSSNPPQQAETTIDKTTTTGNGFVGYYADVDGNGTIDGIIYADLLVGAPTGQWANSNGTYTLPADVNSENVKDYVLSSSPQTDARFEASGADASTYTARYVVKPASTTTGTKDRFYVMGLNDITDGTNSSLYWYNSAYGNMSDYATYTSVDFGKGAKNTTDMLTKWNAAGYGTKNDRDLWKWINVGSGQANAGWFVPSRGEWAAFGKAFNITSSNYGNFNLSSYYWSSSQISGGGAWDVHFNLGCMGYDNGDGTEYVRLSTTF